MHNNIAFYTGKGCLTMLLVGTVNMLCAQNVPNGSTRPVATPVTVPLAYTNTAINYIRTWEPVMPATDTAVVTSTSRTVKEVRQNTQYFDGLGRPLQTVSKGTSSSGKDLVTSTLYDEFGREQFKYLPYAQQSGNTSDGKFKTDPFNSQKAFYQNTTLNPGAVGESVYYNRVDFEPSPLDRELKTYAPGNTCAKNDVATVERGGNRPVEQQYLMNIAADGVRIWDMPATGGIIPTSATNRVYAAGELYKNVTRDERGARVVEFRDKEDHVVLKKAELTGGAADGHNGWLCTYYIYDDLGYLRCVIPPKAVELIKSSWVIDAVTAGELCFFYRYDGRNRMIIKKMPGADSTEMVYDVRDRLVFTRDGNLKAQSRWLVTFYDDLNRPAMTALYNSASTREALQGTMNSATSGTQTITHNIPEPADLVIAYHDGRSRYMARTSITFENGFEAGTSETQAEINPAANQDTFSIVATNPLPDIAASALTPLTYTFYDNYSYAGKHAAESGDFNKPQAGSNPYAEPVTATSTMTNGFVTGTKVRVLGTDKWLTTTTYYNDKGRVIQSISDNIGEGRDIVTNLYDFSGKLLSVYQRHKNLRSGTTPETTLRTMFSYDAAGRLDSLKNRVNDVDSLQRTISLNSYDELGQLKTKRLGVTGTATQMETLNYEYNIRGWLMAVNKGFVNTAGSTANWFGQELSYDYGFATNQYNSNIAGIKWKSKSDNIPRAYGYNYDLTNSLTVADFTQQNSGSTEWKRDQKDFSVSGLTYDANGNIQSMTQRGMNGTTLQTIDSLKYGYGTNSNKLSFVTDKRNNSQSQLGDFKEINNNETQDYWYDSSGNVIKDLNKNIAVIRYNHLNLPDSIAVTGKGTVKYLYDALGNKLRKIVTDNTVTPSKIVTTDYINGFVYQNDSLQFISHEEGRIRTVFKTGQPVNYKYDYFVKDHLGNVRVVLTEQSDFSMYAATMEAENTAKETALFSNVEETRAAKPVGYPQDNTTDKNAFVAKLNAKNGGRKIGPSIVLRVMAGDSIQIGARAFYKSTGPKDKGSTAPVEDMIAGLVQAFGGQSSSAGNTHAAAQDGNLNPFAGNFNGNDYQRLKEKDPNQSKQDKPKAYLNFVLFDDNFNLVGENSGVRQVKGEPDELQTLAVDKMPVQKSGFLYVYTSNETQQDVFFDNVTVLSTPGPLLEETHYYPFGLTMAGISSTALKGANYPKNRYGFNSIEQNNDLDLNMYDARYRNLDPQTGRFWQIDPKPTDNISMYAAMNNNPIRFSDPLGDSIKNPRDQREAARIEGNINRKIANNNQSIANSQNAIATNNARIKTLKDNVKSGSLAGRDLKKANREVNRLERSNNRANADIAEVQGQNAQLNQSLNNINALRADVAYNYTFGGAPGFGSGEHGVLMGTGNNVIIQGSNDGLYIHEIRHIGQSLANGGLRFSVSEATRGRLLNAGTNPAQRSAFEVDAYRVQFSIDRNSYPAPGGARVLGDINEASLRTITGDNGSPIY
ncbi:DUF6443 domain-containing protein [Chitinophaga ginsengisegetis]|uniref:DUF6443 domain-containing protein n=1 Tax=Chitinophaga ginsengisegetis TaxID=393003 RepID=UPI000DBA96E3|nr:DUF6443 domain-containing protein [Chitinophaga ginsengisegetis]MDR6571143.1 RHS repeat-associated protein [Chitinophaga ginsengisegetis]MDR6650877.1 RHS repeat-associated protein [Chitinophaga ginsengisegetis]MDR6657236.1 RHS repeat-associated protein [Chitinophaga ginsengisegetis]